MAAKNVIEAAGLALEGWHFVTGVMRRVANGFGNTFFQFVVQAIVAHFRLSDFGTLVDGVGQRLQGEWIHSQRRCGRACWTKPLHVWRV